MRTIDAVCCRLDRTNHTAIVILVADASPGMAEAIIISDITWDVVGIDDREAGQRRTDLHVPRSI
jgi:hypothetical protein